MFHQMCLPQKGGIMCGILLTGYGIGLVAALAAGILSQSPQPALLYLVSVVRLYSEVLDIIALFRSVKLCFSDLCHVYFVALSHGIV